MNSNNYWTQTNKLHSVIKNNINTKLERHLAERILTPCPKYKIENWKNDSESKIQNKDCPENVCKIPYLTILKKNEKKDPGYCFQISSN